MTQAVGAPFRWVAAVRRARALHPDGVVCAGTARLCAAPFGSVDVVSAQVTVRLSKGAGTPGGLPDVAGVAMRMTVADADHTARPWDLLLASSNGIVGRVGVPLPAVSWSTAVYSSLVPFSTGSGLWWVRAELVADPHLTDLAIGSVAGGVTDRRPIRLVVSQAHGITGAFTPFAEISLDRVDDADHIDFDPIRNVPPQVSLFPGWLASLRRSSYDQSRSGRPTDS